VLLFIVYLQYFAQFQPVSVFSDLLEILSPEVLRHVTLTTVHSYNELLQFVFFYSLKI